VPDVPSDFNLDLLRASLGPELAMPYVQAFGAVPWLTAGTLGWPAGAAEPVLDRWLRWVERLPDRTLTAVRLGTCEAAVDVAVVGDPWGAPARLTALRDLEPRTDTVALAGTRMFRSRASVAAAAVALAAPPRPDALLAAAAAAPHGVCLGLRATAGGLALIGVAPADDMPHALAAIDQAARGLDRMASRERPGSDRRAMGGAPPG
jgi:hypothetical protein